MHVAILKDHVSPCGGLEKATMRIAQALKERNALVTIVNGTPSLPRWPKWRRLEHYDCYTRAWVAHHKPDLVFGMERTRQQHYLRAGNGVHAAYLTTRSLFKQVTACFSPAHRKILELEKEGFEYPLLEKIFTNSSMVREEILHFYSVAPEKIEVIHNGVEWEEMRTDFEEWPERRVLFMRNQGLDCSQFQFLFVGNGYTRKGLKQLLYAFAQLGEGHLSVVGRESHESMYRSLADRLGVGKRVTFFGPQRTIRPFYQFADALVIPSLYDPFANVTVEALAMGLFVVSSKNNGGHEILSATNGAIVEQILDRDSLTTALRTALHVPKTPTRALSIRESVKHLDYSQQMTKMLSFVRMYNQGFAKGQVPLPGF